MRVNRRYGGTEGAQAATCNRVEGVVPGWRVAAWPQSPELSHKRRKGFHA